MIRKRAPFAGSDDASTVPSCAFVTAATIESPSPTPPLSRERDSVGAGEPLEDALPVFRCETGARVLHFEDGRPSSRPRRMRIGCAGRRVRADVRKEVVSTTWRFDVGLDRPAGLDGSRGLDGLRHENLDEQEAAERRVDVRERRRDDEDRVGSLLRRR